MVCPRRIIIVTLCLVVPVLELDHSLTLFFNLINFFIRYFQIQLKCVFFKWVLLYLKKKFIFFCWVGWFLLCSFFSQILFIYLSFFFKLKNLQIEDFVKSNYLIRLMWVGWFGYFYAHLENFVDLSVFLLKLKISNWWCLFGWIDHENWIFEYWLE